MESRAEEGDGGMPSLSSDLTTSVPTEVHVEQTSLKPVASAGHTAALLAALVVWFTLSFLHFRHLQGGAPLHLMTIYLRTIVWNWLLVGYIAYGVRKRGSSLRALIGKRWNSVGDAFKDFGVAAAFWLISLIGMALVSHLFQGLKSSEAFIFMAPRNSREFILWMALAVTAGICEEIIFRGYFQQQLMAWTGNAPVAIIVVAAFFGAGHLYQGAKPALVITSLGLMLGVLAWYRKSLVPGMISHSWQDILAGLVLMFMRIR
jgi:uncharacterized protein